MNPLYLLLFLISALIFMAYAVRYYIFSFVILSFDYTRLQRQHALELKKLDTENQRLVTVLIPAFKEFGVLERIINGVMHLEYSRLQVIVVNDGHIQDRGRSALILEELKEKYPNLFVIHRLNGGRGKSAALNDALPYAQGDFILFLDADYVPDPWLIRYLIPFFLVDEKCAAVQGFIEPHNNGLIPKVCKLERISGYCTELFARERLKLVTQLGGTTMMLRTDVIQKLQFSTRTLTEDTDLTFRLLINGFRVHYTTLGGSTEDAPTTLRAYWRQHHRWAYGHIQCALQHTIPILRSRLSLREKIDALFVLEVYFLPIITLLNLVILIVAPFDFVSWPYIVFGSSAPFFTVIFGALKFKQVRALKYLPGLMLFFPLNAFISLHALAQLFWNTVSRRELPWAHTPHGR